jgi:hypothetical protein
MGVKTPSRVIVTASDENFAWVCLTLLESLGKWARITYVIDIGLSPTSRQALASRCAGVIDIPESAWTSADAPTAYSGAMTIRPQLPQVFAHEYIMWIDSDIWVQNRAAVGVYFDLARANRENFVIAAMVDAEYPYCIDSFDTHQEHFRNLHAQLWDDSVAEQLNGKAPLNSGVFAASRSSPVWQEFEARVKDQYLHNVRVKNDAQLAHMAEQQCLHRILHESQRFTVMSADFNWVCHAGPLVRKGFFVETPNLHRRPHIVHLTVLRGLEAHYREKYLIYESRRQRMRRFVRQRFLRLAD